MMIKEASVMQTQTIRSEGVSAGNIAMDTTFILFFLAMDLGTILFSFDLGTALSGITLAMFVVLPYFLFEGDAKPRFGIWVAGRTIIAFFAIFIGILFKQALGSVLPESFRHLPLALLIMSAIVSGFVMIYGIMKVRLAG